MSESRHSARYDLAGRVALVTGGSRGLGAAISLKLGACGAKVAVNYFGSPDRADDIVRQIRRAGGVAEALGRDVRDEQQVTHLMGHVRERLGAVEILVINATGPQPFVDASKSSTWRACLDQLEFFVKSPLLLAKAVLPEMKRREAGRIIQIGSEVFERGVPEFSSYVAAKAAQLGLTRSWAMELAPFGITVNLVAPGWIPTERHENDPPEAKEAYRLDVPMRRMGKPDDVAEAVAFLASDAAAFITGQKLSVNGGNTLE